MKGAVLSIRDLWFRYPGGDWVLRGLDLVVEKGEHVLVVGETGSGKTTLARAIMGTGVLVYGGELRGDIRLLGKSVFEYGAEELGKSVHYIGQNPYLFFTEPLVRDDLYSYALRVHRNSESAAKAFAKAIEAAGIHEHVYKYFFELSGGEARRVLVAKSLIADPVLLIFDEPLMWLDDRGVADFVELLSLLRRLGKSVVVLEHRFLPIYRRFDRVLLLRSGALINVTDALHRYARALATEPGGTGSTNGRAESSGEKGEVVLRAANLHYDYNGKPVLRGVSLEVSKREKVLICGANGSGKTTLLKVLSGYLKPKKGVVEKKGGAIYVPQNIALFYTEETVEKEIKEVCRARRLGQGCVEEGLKRASRLGIPLDQSPFNLSHGQMVKLAVELALVAGSSVVLLDEPFSGLTYRDRLELLEHLQRVDLGVVLATSSRDVTSKKWWSRAYRLEGGVLSEIELSVYSELTYASRLYEEVLRHAQRALLPPSAL
jgi:energy-coupling factor transport system ATP-binding protein